jgi:DnaJ-class molecular chaperone
LPQAYEVLSDAEKRKVYDRFGDDGLKAKEQGADMSGPFAGAYGGGGGGYGGAPAGFGGGFSPFGSGGGVSFGSFPGGVRFSTGGSGSSAAGLDDLLGMLFGQRPTGGGGFGGGGFGGGGFGDGVPDGGARARKAAKPIEVSCSLAQVYAGCTKKLKLTLRGVTTYVTVTVPPGARAGAELIAQAADGDEAPPAGVRFVLRELPHPWLERAGDDLIWRCALSHEQATAKKGVRLKIKTLDGRELTVSTRALRVRDGARHVLRGEGMPVGAGKGGAAKQRGDLIIVFPVHV